ncbi:DNA replication/repair protein RecF [Patescibacteria group bacterium]|nr:DNA replication/repair protein RecF [Patescibacteria group bacterium]
MKCTSLTLINFRNISNAEISFGKNNFLVGDNGQGKTNVLEALYYLSAGDSFRSSKEAWAIKTGELFARIEASFELDNGNPRVANVVLERDEVGVTKNFRLDNAKVSKADFLGSFLMVLFAPDNVSLMRLQPVTRRAFMNHLIAKVDPTYYDDLMAYAKALKQRNQLLTLVRRHQADVKELSPWDDRMSVLGSQIIKKRQALIDALGVWVGPIYSQITGQVDARLRVVYQTDAGVIGPEQYISRLIKNRDEDIRYGHTTFGPHRDDLVFLLNDLDARQVASQGEFRLIMVALRLAEGEYIKKQLQESPIYLLDDIFSELDEGNSKRVINFLEDAQIIITTTDRHKISKDANVLNVEAGVISGAISNDEFLISK